MTESPDTGSRVYVAGHQGLVGSALVRRLRAEGYGNLVLKDRASLDLTRQADVEDFFAQHRPDAVYLAAAKVGGIKANSLYPADFIRENLAIQSNVIEAARLNGVRKLIFLGSSCIYPRDCPQPIREEYLLTGPLEASNEWYAVAKIAGLKMCQAYRRQYGFDAVCAMPTNLYGPGDNFHPEHSHVLPALVRRFHEAARERLPEVLIWGTGRPMREFLHVDDLASALVHLLRTDSAPDLVNIGSGEEISILDLARMIAKVTGYNGRIVTEPSLPDGTPRKVLDSGRMRALGWAPDIPLEQGITATYQWFLANQGRFRD